MLISVICAECDINAIMLSVVILTIILTVVILSVIFRSVTKPGIQKLFAIILRKTRMFDVSFKNYIKIIVRHNDARNLVIPRGVTKRFFILYFDIHDKSFFLLL